jgi:hypothetical protein
MKRLLYLAALLTSFPALGLANGFSGVVGIKTVHIEGNGFAMVILTSPAANPDSCGNSSEAMVRDSDAWYQSTLSLLMEAYALNAGVQFYFTGCEQTPWGYSIPIIWSTDLNP